MARSTVLRFLYRSSSKPGAVRLVILCEAGGPAVGLLRDGVPDAAPPQVLTTGTVAVGLVGRDAVGFLAGPARSEPRDPDLPQHRDELCAVGPLPRRDDQGKRAAAAVRAQMGLAGETAARTTQAFASRATSASRPTGSATEFRPDVPAPRPPLRRRGPAAGRCGHQPHADALGRWWSPPRYPSRSPLPRRRGLNLLQQPFPGSVSGPEPMALVDRLPRTGPLRQITPVHPGPYPVQNPVDHLPVITPPPTPPVAHRQERPQPLPLGIRKTASLTLPHTQGNDPIRRPSHDRPDSS